MNAHAATQLVLCKVEGCEQPARATRGRYAFLCDDHIEDARTKTERLLGLEAAAAPAKLASLSEQAKRLVSAAKQLEQRVDARRQSLVDVRQALEQFNDELNLVKQAAEALLRG